MRLSRVLSASTEPSCVNFFFEFPIVEEISAKSRRNLGEISAKSRRNLGEISAKSRRNLGENFGELAELKLSRVESN
jgi:hypothetical protein